MEVFLRVPVRVDLETLTTELQPVMHKLSISQGQYFCEKPRSKRKGYVRFVREEDAHTFLYAHGEELEPEEETTKSRLPNQQSRSKTKPRLQILGIMIHCRPSTRKWKPLDPTAPEFFPAEPQPHSSESTSSVLVQTLGALDCGHCEFIKGYFAFVAEWEHREYMIAKFAMHSLTIELCSLHVIVHVGYADINELVWSATGTVTIILTTPPTFLGRQPVRDSFTTAMERLAFIDEAHGRVSNFCTVYQFRVACSENFRHDMEILKAKGINTTEYDAEYYRVPDVPGLVPYPDGICRLMDEISHHEKAGTLPFAILFLCQALVHNGHLHPANASILIQELAARFAEARKRGRCSEYPISVEAFKTLFSNRDQLPSPSDSGSPFEVDRIMATLDAQEKLIRSGEDIRSALAAERENRTRVFYITITPTRILLGGPTMERGNRVLRKYPRHPEHFLRVHFCDENGQGLFNNVKVCLGKIYSRFKLVLRSGFLLGGRKYSFLGFPHSSLRSHSVWVAAPFSYESRHCESGSILEQLGDFTDVGQSPALLAARIGQVFSETPHVFSLGSIKPKSIPDKEVGRYLFSDGVGKISRTALEKVHRSFDRLRGYPTSFQFRWAGVKGVLSLDPSLEGDEIHIRPKSMRKFEGYDQADLEICGTLPKPIVMVLNRPLIKILEDRGAPYSWFLGLQRKHIADLQTVVADIGITESFLKSRSIGKAARLGNLISYAYTKGLDYRHDTFMQSAVKLILQRDLRDLKHKGRIRIRKGITLIGVMDETEYLEKGQVYVTYDWDESQHCIEPPPENGPVIVTRSPAMHPGDFQKVENKRPSKDHNLASQRNCIVFSQKGERDLPSQLAGGDLDGDLYHIIWDPDLVVHAPIIPHEPAKYEKREVVKLSKPVELSDMSDWFVDFMENDHLREIAATHMILADGVGTMDGKCIQLAGLHSDAVDFSKSGRAVDRSQIPRAPTERPDFMNIFGHHGSQIPVGDAAEEQELGQRPRHTYYKSKGALGRLYRGVDEQKVWNGNAQWTKSSLDDCQVFWNKLWNGFLARAVPVGAICWWDQLERAKQLYGLYQRVIKEVATSRSEHPCRPLREREIFVGVIIDEAGAQTNRQRDRSKRLREEFDEIVWWIMGAMRSRYPITGYASKLDALELCLACLYLSHGSIPNVQTTRAESKFGMESFRVIAASAVLSELEYLEGSGRPDSLCQ